MSACVNCGGENRGLTLCPGCGYVDTASPKPPMRRRRYKGVRSGPAPASARAIPSASATEEQYDRILTCIREHGPMTRRALWKATTIDYNVVTPRVRELLDAGRLVEGALVRNDSSKAARLVQLPHGRAVRDAAPQQGFALEEGAA